MFKINENKRKEIDNIIKCLDNAKKTLKKEYFGIDKQIDEICENVLSWYASKDYQKSPYIINLWGMTGCGKTSLINRLLELIELDRYKIYFNFAQIQEMRNYEIEDFIYRKISTMTISSPIMIYDEFQYAKTIEMELGMRKEIDKPTMKIFWDIMDSGKYGLEFKWYTQKIITNFYKTFKSLLNNNNVEIENGEITKGFDYLKYIFSSDFFKTNKKDDFYINKNEATKLSKELNVNLSYFKTPILNDDVLENMLEIASTIEPDKYLSTFDIAREIKTKKNKEELFNFIEQIYKKLVEGYNCDMSKGIIFVIGNLDDAYKISDDMSPDMSADQYHIYTSKINIVDIKSALHNRFRNEQISRLGNIHLIYPSFNSKTYKDIIQKQLHEFSCNIKNNYNFEVVFNKNINEILFKEAVFPTQGVRPLLSTINEVIKTKTPYIIQNAIVKSLSFDKIEFFYKKNKICVTYFNSKKEIVSLCFDTVFRTNNERKKKNKNFQTLCAVHETGHMILNLVKFNELPSKLCSVVVDNEIGGFMLKDFSKEHILNKISLTSTLCVNLGGRAAEEIVFGKEMVSNGSYSDLKKATELTISSVRNCGFGNILPVNSYDSIGSEKKIYDNNESDKTIRELIDNAYQESKEIIKLQLPLLIKCSKYLINNSEINIKKLIQLIKENYVGNIPSIIFNKNYEEKIYINKYKEFINYEEIK